MNWGNPWAWVGLAALAVPLLIHMLGRQQAKTVPFPTLRFLEPARLQPVRRTRVQDPGLLAIRVGILVFAVTALAQPRFGNGRDIRAATSLSRVIIVDTSASMSRLAAAEDQTVAVDGETAVAFARREAQRIAAEAASSLIVETAAPAEELAGASAWLAGEPGRGELVVLSDFQPGTVDAAALTVVAPGLGVDLRRIAVEIAGSRIETTSRTAGIATVALAMPTTAGLDVAWTTGPGPDLTLDGLFLLAEEAGASAARDAATAAWRSLPDVRFDASRPVAIVYEGYSGRAALLRDARPPGAPWMAETIRRVREDVLFAAAAEQSEPMAEPDVALSPDGPFARVGDASSGAAVATSAVIDGRDHLVFFASASPASLVSAALIGAVGRALTDPSPVSELDPLTMADSTLASWRRAPEARTTTSNDVTGSDGRWLWLVALVLLVAEALFRRRAAASRRDAAPDMETPS